MALVDSVRLGLAELEPLDIRDRACADLALLIAARIDDDEGWQDRQRDPLAELGPKLLACLTALAMTPQARKTAMPTPAPAAKNPLDELRARRAERAAK